MRFSLLALAMVLLFPKLQAQGPQNHEEPILDFETVDRSPRFPGGDWEFLSFFNKNLMLPTPTDSLMRVKKIVCHFTVETDGSITGLEFPKPTILDNAVKRLFEKMPAWEPGMHRGRLARVRYRMPIFINIE